jgi:hypothetical protein
MVEDLIERTCQKKTCQHVKKSGHGNCGHDSRKKNQESKRQFHLYAFSECFQDKPLVN